MSAKFFGARRDKEKIIAETAPGTPAPQAVPTILILCRDDDTRLLYRMLLEMCRCRVQEACDCNELLTVAARVQPEVILVDGELPIESTLETIKEIRASLSLRDTPVLLISGYPHSKISACAARAGASEVLTKPLDFDRLCLIMRKYVDLR